MASVWGDAWGYSWGNAWGVISQSQLPSKTANGSYNTAPPIAAIFNTTASGVATNGTPIGLMDASPNKSSFTKTGKSSSFRNRTGGSSMSRTNKRGSFK